MRALRSALLLAVVALLLAACAQPMREGALAPPAAPQLPPGFPVKEYQQAQALGKPVYRVDPARSLVTITVRKGGSLARFGHDHVVAGHAVQGYVSPDEGRADLYVLLNDLAVDEAGLRSEAGLDTRPTESEIEDTRSNMLDKVLEAQKFPFALVRVSSVERTSDGARLQLALTLHGVRRTFDVPVQLQTGPGEARASGVLEFNQSDFGIVPFSILGGAVQVQDRLSLRFSIRASLPSD